MNKSETQILKHSLLNALKRETQSGFRSIWKHELSTIRINQIKSNQITK